MRDPPLIKPPLINEPPLVDDGLDVGTVHDRSLALHELELPLPELSELSETGAILEDDPDDVCSNSSPWRLWSGNTSSSSRVSRGL